MSAANILESKAFNVFSWLAAACGLIAVGLAVALQVAGLHVVVVQTGSMNPSIAPGSVVLTKVIDAAQAKPGDVLTIRQPDGGFVTHRLVSVRPAPGGIASVVETRGDANLTKDPLPLTVEKVNKVRTVIPAAGKFLDAMSSKFVAVIFGALIVAGLAVVFYDVTRDKSQQSPNAPAVLQVPRKQQAAQPARTLPIAAPAKARVAPKLYDQGPTSTQLISSQPEAIPVVMPAAAATAPARHLDALEIARVARIVALGMTEPTLAPASAAARLMGIPEDQFISPEFVQQVMGAVETTQPVAKGAVA